MWKQHFSKLCKASKRCMKLMNLWLDQPTEGDLWIKAEVASTQQITSGDYKEFGSLAKSLADLIAFLLLLLGSVWMLYNEASSFAYREKGVLSSVMGSLTLTRWASQGIVSPHLLWTFLGGGSNVNIGLTFSAQAYSQPQSSAISSANERSKFGSSSLWISVHSRHMKCAHLY